jgi:glucan biosynthesis protein C
MTATTASSTLVRPARLFYLDNLRVALTVLVVLHHVAVGYSRIPDWYYYQAPHDPTGTLLDWFLEFDQSFFMGLFFLISGFFTPGAVDRKGPGRFVRDRLLRLGVPLLVFALLLRPLLTLPGYFGSGQSFWSHYLATWDPGPAWFLEVLLIFALGYALLRRWRPAAAPTGEPAAPSAAAVGWFVVGLTAITAAWRLVVPLGSVWPGIGLPTPAYLPQYTALFVVGVLAQRRGWLTALTPRAGRIAWLGAAASILVLVPAFVFGSGALQLVARAAFESALPTFLAIGLVVLFRDRWNRQRARAKFRSDNAFGVYLLHPIPLVLVALAATDLTAPALVKFALVSVIGVPLCWMLAAGVRAVPGVRRFL